LQSASDSALIPLLVERMNRLRFGADITAEERTAFNRAATLLTQFRERGIASWAEQSGNAKRYELILSNYSPAYISDVEELLRLLDLHGDPAHESTIRIPVVMGVRDRNFDGLAIQTRSVAAIMRSAAAAIDVPREHVEEGIVNATAEPVGALDATGRVSAHPIKQKRTAADERCGAASRLVVLRGWYRPDKQKNVFADPDTFPEPACRGDARNADHAALDHSGQVTALNELFGYRTKGFAAIRQKMVIKTKTTLGILDCARLPDLSETKWFMCSSIQQVVSDTILVF
jgi:hypothetical protein